jgi:hypothetical protein
VINDLATPWSGQLRLRLLRGAKMVSEQTQPCTVGAFGDVRRTFAFAAPGDTGAYTLEAALVAPGTARTRSLRDITVGSAP